MELMNPMQERQNKVSCEFVVQGLENWQEPLMQELELNDDWAKVWGTSKISMLDYLRKDAVINWQSFERAVVIAFLNLGYQLEELEVEINEEGANAWGRSVWYKEHPNYQKPVPKDWIPANFQSRFYYATFKTEHADDQVYCIHSTQQPLNNSMLPYKTLIYHRVVFSPPATDTAA